MNSITIAPETCRQKTRTMHSIPLHLHHNDILSASFPTKENVMQHQYSRTLLQPQPCRAYIRDECIGRQPFTVSFQLHTGNIFYPSVAADNEHDTRNEDFVCMAISGAHSKRHLDRRALEQFFCANTIDGEASSKRIAL